MFGLEILAKLVKILRSAASPAQIAGGFIIGMIIGLTPFWSLHNLLLFFLLIILNVNITTALFSLMICTGMAYLLDPAFHHLGYLVLVDLSFLKGMWTYLYNFPVVALSRYNNTIVMGSLLVSLLLTIPVFILVKKGVIAYREHIDARMQKWKIVQLVKGSKIYNIYVKIRNLGD